MSLMYGLLILIELSEGARLMETYSFLYLISVFGEISDVLLPELVKTYFLNEPAILTIILLFIFVLSTIIVFQLRETLPIKSEMYIKPKYVIPN